MAHSQYHNSAEAQEQASFDVSESGERIISSIGLDLSSSGASSFSRQISINGTDGCVFNIQVFNSSGQFYDFNANSFSSGFSFYKNL